MFKGLFDLQSRFDKIDSNGDPLVSLNQAIDWDLFRPDLEPLRARERKSPAGRKPYDLVLLFKMLVLQSLYNLSDDRIEQLVLDRLSFHRFLGLTFGDPVPDAKTIWAFREALNADDRARLLFDKFESFLSQKGFQARKGQIIDASIVEVPKQRNSQEENALIKNGEAEKVRAGWSPAKAAQKDTDARWTKKNNKNFFGYKHHDSVDAAHKLVRDYSVTPANVHDSQEFVGLLGENKEDAPSSENVNAELPAENMDALPVEAAKVELPAENADAEVPVETDMRDVYADSAYRSAEHESILSARNLRSHILKKGTRGQKLTEQEQDENHKHSKVRVRIEHVYGSMRQRMGDTVIRAIGLVRATTKIGLRLLTYNLDRYAFLAGDIV